MSAYIPPGSQPWPEPDRDRPTGRAPEADAVPPPPPDLDDEDDDTTDPDALDLSQTPAIIDALYRYADPDSYCALRVFPHERGAPPPWAGDVKAGDLPGLIDAITRGARYAASSTVPTVFCPVTGATFRRSGTAKTRDIAEGLALAVELDQGNTDAILARLEALLGPATLVVLSGSEWIDPDTGEVHPKRHAYWRLSEVARDEADQVLLYTARQDAAQLTGADPTGAALAHCYRWPGSLNRKNPARPVPCVVDRINPGAEIHLIDATELLADAVEGTGLNGGAGHKGNGAYQGKRELQADPALVAAAMTFIPNHDVHYGEWIRWGYAVCGASAGTGYNIWLAWSKQSTKHDDGETEATWKRIIAAAVSRIGAGSIFAEARRHGWVDPRSGEGPATPQPEGPRPLRRELPTAPPFPIDALASVPALRNAVAAIHSATQAPLSLCGNSVLAAASICAQAHGNVQMPYEASKPLSLFMMSVAYSGERKNSVDDLATKPILEREAELRTEYGRAFQDHLHDLDAYNAHKTFLQQSLKKNRNALRKALAELGPTPSPPLQPIILADNPTVEGIENYAAIGQPSFGLFTAEGGKLIGGYLFNDDNRMKAGATLNLFWDGVPVPRIRAQSATKLPGRRLAMHIMVQPEIAARMLADPTLTGLGTVARFLVAAPESAAGTRAWRERAPWVADALSDYHAVLRALLQREPQKGAEANELAPRALPLSPEARQSWICFHDATELQLKADAAWAPIRGMGSKLPEHAARLAGILALVADPDTAEIGLEAMAGGIALARYYVAEALRLVEIGLCDPELVLAEKLLRWLHADLDREVTHLREIYQLGPNAIRDKATAMRIVALLVDHGHIRKLKPGTVVDGHRRRDAWQIIR